MLAQFVQRKVAKEQSRRASNSRSFLLASLMLSVFALSPFLISCGSKPADLRAFIPADSLIFLESNDLGAVMNTITERPAFREAAKSIPDFSVLNGVKLAVAVTGFETKEQPVTDENSVLSFQPRFVAILETNAWNFQALAFTEHKLGEFINNVYGGEVELQTTDKNDGRNFVWTAQDGRKAYALVKGSVVFFGNDETAIEKSLAVKRGEAESIARNPKITDGDRLAFGYVSTDGVAQVSNLLGMYISKRASEEGEVQSFVARVLPEILRNSVNGLTWSATKINDKGIEDKFAISLDTETARILSETVKTSGKRETALLRYLPNELTSTTRYDFTEAQMAWRSVVLTTRTKTDQVSGGLLAAFSSSLFEPYAVEEPELFLSSVSSALQTVIVGNDSDEAAVIANVKVLETLKRSIAKEIDLNKPPEKFGNAELWRSADDELGFGLIDSKVILGDLNVVQKCVEAGTAEQGSIPARFASETANSNAPILTLGFELNSAGSVAGVISERKEGNAPQVHPYTVETRFNSSGIERKTTSDFGFIGWIIAQFAEKEE